MALERAGRGGEASGQAGRLCEALWQGREALRSTGAGRGRAGRGGAASERGGVGAGQRRSGAAPGQARP